MLKLLTYIIFTFLLLTSINSRADVFAQTFQCQTTVSNLQDTGYCKQGVYIDSCKNTGIKETGGYCDYNSDPQDPDNCKTPQVVWYSCVWDFWPTACHTETHRTQISCLNSVPTPTPVCTNRTFSGSFSPSSVPPSGYIQINCNYGTKASSLGTITPLINGTYPGCAWLGWSGNTAQYNCMTPSTPGTYDVSCDTTSNTCNDPHSLGNVTVIGPPTITPTPTPTSTPTPTPTPTNTPTPTPTPIPDNPWCKYKDASIITNSAINNPIPASPLTPYDASDPGNRVLVDSSSANSAGVVGAQSISIGGAQVSATGWDITGATFSPQFTIQEYIDYVRSKKSSMVNEGSIVSGKINILSGNQTITEASLSGKRPLIVIVEGNITLSSTTNILNQANEPQVIISTGTITFSTTMTEANGIYIANNINFGTTANQGLKIIGNLVTESALSCTRQWSDTKKPGVFIVFDPSHYIEMIEMLSTTTYDWRQIQ